MSMKSVNAEQASSIFEQVFNKSFRSFLDSIEFDNDTVVISHACEIRKVKDLIRVKTLAKDIIVDGYIVEKTVWDKEGPEEVQIGVPQRSFYDALQVAVMEHAKSLMQNALDDLATENMVVEWKEDEKLAKEYYGEN